MKPITIDEIDYTVSYKGYVWYSGERQPIFIDRQIDATDFDPAAKGKTNSLFVVESNLYASAQKRSISIRYVDGQYLIHQFDLANIDPELLTSQRYKSHRLNGIQFVKMMQYWDEVEDELLEGMKTLVPTWTVFVGFV